MWGRMAMRPYAAIAVISQVMAVGRGAASPLRSIAVIWPYQRIGASTRPLRHGM